MSLRFRLPLFGIAISLCAVVILAEPLIGAEGSARGLSLVVGFVGLSIFVLHGASRITVTGLFSIAYALFCGYGGWIVIDVDGVSTGLSIALLVTAMGLASSALLMGPVVTPRVPETDALDGRLYVAGGTATIISLILLRNSLPMLLVEGASFMATVVVGVGLIFGRSRRVALAAPVLIFPYVIAYSELFHGSSGRLRLVAVGSCLALLYSARFQASWHKAAMLCLIPPILGYLAWDRLQTQEAFGGRAASAGNTGLESMITPARAFGLLVDAQGEGHAELRWGESFLSPMTAIVPDGWRGGWDPAVFNYELVAITSPARYGTGYSTAGSYFGEWWWNFGALGIVLAVLVTGPLLCTLDRLTSRTLASVGGGVVPVVFACIVLAFAGSIADLAWAGFHTWFVRGVARLPLIALFLVVGMCFFRRGGGVIASKQHSRSAGVSTG